MTEIEKGYLPDKATQLAIKQGVDEINIKSDQIKLGVDNVNTNVSTVKTDVASVKNNVTTVNTTVNTINSNLGTPTSSASNSTGANAHAKLNYLMNNVDKKAVLKQFIGGATQAIPAIWHH